MRTPLLLLLLFASPLTSALKRAAFLGALPEPASVVSLANSSLAVSAPAAHGVFLLQHGSPTPSLLAGSPIRAAGGAPPPVGAPPLPCTSATFNTPRGLAAAGPFAPGGEASSLLVCDTGSHVVRAIALHGDTCTVTTLAGSSGVAGFINGFAAGAAFSSPWALAVDDAAGAAFVADAGNGALRAINSTGAVSTITAGLSRPTGVALSSLAPLDVFVVDAGSGGVLLRLRRAGGDGSTVALAAGLGAPTGLALTASGDALLTVWGGVHGEGAALLLLGATAPTPGALAAEVFAGEGAGKGALVVATASLPTPPQSPPAPQHRGLDNAVSTVAESPNATTLGGLHGVALRGEEVLLLGGSGVWSVIEKGQPPPLVVELFAEGFGAFLSGGVARKMSAGAGRGGEVAERARARSMQARPCNAGTWGTSPNCVNCPLGHFCTGGVKTACPAGKYQDSQKSSACDNCPIGRANAGTGAQAVAACSACPASTYAGAGSSSCATCTVGFFCPGGTNRVPCPCAATACPSTGAASATGTCSPPLLGQANQLHNWLTYHLRTAGKVFEASPTNVLYLTPRAANDDVPQDSRSMAWGPVFNAYMSFTVSFSFASA